MADNFLDQFSKKDFKVENNENKPEIKENFDKKAKVEEKHKDKAQVKQSSKEIPKAKEDSIEETKIKPILGLETGKATDKTSHQKIASTEHIIEKDDSYHKRNLIRYGVIGGSVFAICLVAFFIFRMMNQVEIKDFVGTSITEARTWGLTNSITIEVVEVFNLEYDEDIIMDQSVEASSKLQKGSVLNLTVSKGADPDELIELPDFESMTTSEIFTWRQKFKVFNVNIREEYHEEIEKGEFIKMEFGSKEVTAENYTRGDGLIIYMSKGPEIFEANIEVPDFKNQPLMAVEEWAKSNDIELTVEEKASDSVPTDSVISQSVKAGDKVAKHDEITVVVSLGKSVAVPNFSSLTAEEATMAAPELNIMVQHRYHASIAFGKLISQSEAAGNELLVDDMTRITVVYSLGRPYIDNLVGVSEGDIPKIFHEFTSQGANITYSINYVDSYEDKGNIVGMSKYAQFLSMTDHVKIDVSKGNLTPPVETPPVEAPPVETPQENIPDENQTDDVPEEIPSEDE